MDLHRDCLQPATWARCASMTLLGLVLGGVSVLAPAEAGAAEAPDLHGSSLLPADASLQAALKQSCYLRADHTLALQVLIRLFREDLPHTPVSIRVSDAFKDKLIALDPDLHSGMAVLTAVSAQTGARMTWDGTTLDCETPLSSQTLLQLQNAFAAGPSVSAIDCDAAARALYLSGDVRAIDTLIRAVDRPALARSSTYYLAMGLPGSTDNRELIATHLRSDQATVRRVLDLLDRPDELSRSAGIALARDLALSAASGRLLTLASAQPHGVLTPARFQGSLLCQLDDALARIGGPGVREELLAQFRVAPQLIVPYLGTLKDPLTAAAVRSYASARVTSHDIYDSQAETALWNLAKIDPLANQDYFLTIIHTPVERDADGIDCYESAELEMSQAIDTWTLPSQGELLGRLWTSPTTPTEALPGIACQLMRGGTERGMALLRESMGGSDRYRMMSVIAAMGQLSRAQQLALLQSLWPACATDLHCYRAYLWSMQGLQCPQSDALVLAARPQASDQERFTLWCFAMALCNQPALTTVVLGLGTAGKSTPVRVAAIGALGALPQSSVQAILDGYQREPIPEIAAAATAALANHDFRARSGEVEQRP